MEQEQSLAFVDLLGFSNMVDFNADTARIILNDFYNICYDVIQENDAVKGHLFSDSLIVYSTDKKSLVDCVALIYRKCLQKNNEYGNLRNFFILPRGAISSGIINIENRTERPNLRKNFIISPALVHSAKLEALIKGSRLLIAESNNNDETSNILEYARYEDPVLEYMQNYSYKDILWYAKDSSENITEIETLIDISIKLIEQNNASNKILIHHLWTLRIGLLSYSKYLNTDDTVDNTLINIIERFDDDKYWLLWLTIFEIVSDDNLVVHFANDETIKSFYKSCSLKKNWSKVIEELNRPQQSAAKAKFQRLIDELT